MATDPADAASALGGGGDPVGLRSLRRALDILQLFSEDRPAWVTRDVVEATGLPKSTVIRLLQALERTGVLWVNQDRCYVAGPNLLRWSALAASTWQVSAAAQRVVEEAASACSETAHLYVRRGLHRVCIAQRPGSLTLRQIVRVGEELPLWTGGAANVLLIGASPERFRRVAAASPEGAEELMRSVRDTARQGYGASHDVPERGLSMVAVPVRSGDGRVLASLSVGGPSTRITAERVPEYARVLTALAAGLNDADFAGIPQSSFATREGPDKSWENPV